jgi:hypothetical protein
MRIYPRERMKIRTLLLILFTALHSFSQNRGFTLVDKTGKETGSFGTSWALIIGVNDYEEGEIPKLRYAVNDAQGVADLLIKDQGFEKEKVLILMNAKATKENISKSFEFLKQNSAPDDRIVVFFAGHGITLSTPGGREKGYILPVDAKINSYATSSLSVDQLNEWSEQIRSKHIYFVMDACYGGTIFTRGTALSPDAQEYFDVITSRIARQAITAGGRDQQVMDAGDDGHSVFTYHFIGGIKDGLADLNGDGIITAGEIASYVAPQVTASSQSAQTPEYGSIAGSKGGEFVFLAPKTTFKKKPAGEVEKPIQFNNLLERENRISLAFESVLSTDPGVQIGVIYPIDIQKLTKKSILYFLIPNIYGLYIGVIPEIKFKKIFQLGADIRQHKYKYQVPYLKGKFFYEITDFNKLQCFGFVEVTKSLSRAEGESELDVGQGTTIIENTSGPLTLWTTGLSIRNQYTRFALSAEISYTFDKAGKYFTFLGADQYAQYYPNPYTDDMNFNLGLGIAVLF